MRFYKNALLVIEIVAALLCVFWTVTAGELLQIVATCEVGHLIINIREGKGI